MEGMILRAGPLDGELLSLGLSRSPFSPPLKGMTSLGGDQITDPLGQAAGVPCVIDGVISNGDPLKLLIWDGRALGTLQTSSGAF